MKDRAFGRLLGNPWWNEFKNITKFDIETYSGYKMNYMQNET